MINAGQVSEISEIRLSNRLALRYQKSGAGAPLLLLHTIRTQLEYFRGLVPMLADRFTVYALDLPGHGHSPIDLSAKFDEPYFRQGVRAFIEHLDLKDVILAGESIGGTLALTVASELPHRVKAVVATNPYDYDTRYGDGVRRGNMLANIVIGSFGIPFVGMISAALEKPFILGPILRGGFRDKSKLSHDLLLEFDRAGRRPGFRTVERRTFAGWRSWSEARSHYGSIKAVVTIVYGDSDWSTDAERQHTVAAIPGARLVTLARTGHFAALERPKEIASIIRDSEIVGG